MVAQPRILHLYSELPALYVGIDIGKAKHYVAFVSAPLLRKNRKFANCPAFDITNDRSGFECLVKKMGELSRLEKCICVVERTGHYGTVLIEFLRSRNVVVYEIHVQDTQNKNKTDKADALRLANALYNQIALGAQPEDDHDVIQQRQPPTTTALRLKGLVQRRRELITDSTRRRNRLTAIYDQLFPEFALVFKDINCPIALRLRAQFPTPAAIAVASDAALLSCLHKTFGRAKLARLKELAEQSIGIVNDVRVHSLVNEQSQLITELHLFQEHIEIVDGDIRRAVEASREGRILLSFGEMMTPSLAGAILAILGNIRNFETASKLRAYFGWSPKRRQSGTTVDSVSLDRGGNKFARHTVYLLAWRAIQGDIWGPLYHRLVQTKCPYDPRLKRYRGKNKVMGRIAGQIIGVIFVLLKQDANILDALMPGQIPPEPILYDHMHRKS